MQAFLFSVSPVLIFGDRIPQRRATKGPASSQLEFTNCCGSQALPAVCAPTRPRTCPVRLSGTWRKAPEPPRSRGQSRGAAAPPPAGARAPAARAPPADPEEPPHAGPGDQDSGRRERLTPPGESQGGREEGRRRGLPAAPKGVTGRPARRDLAARRAPLRPGRGRAGAPGAEQSCRATASPDAAPPLHGPGARRPASGRREPGGRRGGGGADPSAPPRPARAPRPGRAAPQLQQPSQGYLAPNSPTRLTRERAAHRAREPRSAAAAPRPT